MLLLPTCKHPLQQPAVLVQQAHALKWRVRRQHQHQQAELLAAHLQQGSTAGSASAVHTARGWLRLTCWLPMPSSHAHQRCAHCASACLCQSPMAVQQLDRQYCMPGPPSCTAPLMYCPPHVLPPSCTAPLMYCPPHVLPVLPAHMCQRQRVQQVAHVPGLPGRQVSELQQQAQELLAGQPVQAAAAAAAVAAELGWRSRGPGRCDGVLVPPLQAMQEHAVKGWASSAGA
jgi:hypothetical protein